MLKCSTILPNRLGCPRAGIFIKSKDDPNFKHALCRVCFMLGPSYNTKEYKELTWEEQQLSPEELFESLSAASKEKNIQAPKKAK